MIGDKIWIEEYREGHNANPSWCFVVIAANRHPALFATAAHSQQSSSEGFQSFSSNG